MSAGGPSEPFAALRRAQELVTARQWFEDGLTTWGEFLSIVARVLLEVGTAGLVELLAAQAGLTSFALGVYVGHEHVEESLQKVARILVLTEETSRLRVIDGEVSGS